MFSYFILNVENYERINAKLKVFNSNSIRVLHNVNFEKEGDHGNWKQIRQFNCFKFGITDDVYKKKTDFITSTFSLYKLIIVCNILNIKYDGTKPEVVERFVFSLNDFNVLKINM